MTAALKAEGLTAGYAGVPALHDFELSLEPGQVLTMLGANGAGKTTALMAMVGAIKSMAGTTTSFGETLTGKRIEQIARLGVGLVPDNRGLFPELTVAEHLRLARTDPGVDARDEACSQFPQLEPLLGRRCGLLSGGEQQMLALAKVLVMRPRVLLIDEMSLGLAPLVVQSLLPIIRELATERGTAVVLVEQHVDLALRVSDTGIVLNRGRITLAGPATELLANRAAVEAAYLGGAPQLQAETTNGSRQQGA